MDLKKIIEEVKKGYSSHQEFWEFNECCLDKRYLSHPDFGADYSLFFQDTPINFENSFLKTLGRMTYIVLHPKYLDSTSGGIDHAISRYLEIQSERAKRIIRKLKE